jgi:hypothetical protein
MSIHFIGFLNDRCMSAPGAGNWPRHGRNWAANNMGHRDNPDAMMNVRGGRPGL